MRAEGPREFQVPHLRVFKQRQHRVPVALGLRFDGPPQQQRDALIGDVLLALHHRAHNGQALVRRQPLGTAQQLRAHFGMLFGNREIRDRRREQRTRLALVARAAHDPAAHVRIGMLQQIHRERVAQSAEHVQREQRIERIWIVRVARELFQFRQRGFFLAPVQLERGLETEPFVRVLQIRDQLAHRRGVQVEWFQPDLRVLRSHAIDASVGLAPVINRPHVTEARVVPVREVNAAIRPRLDVHRTEPPVRTAQQFRIVLCAECRGGGNAAAHVAHVLQRVRGDEMPGEFRHQPAIVNRKRLAETLAVALRLHVLEVAERIRIQRRPVFAEALGPAHALIEMHPALRAIRAAEHAPLRVNFAAESIAAAFAENLEHARLWMKTPDVLALKFHVLRHCGRDVARRRAAVRAIEPSVRSPAQTARDGMRVFQSETTEHHLRIAVGDVVVIRVGMEKQIRRVHHPDAARALDRRRRDVQSVEHGLVLVERSAARRILEHHDFVRALRALRRRLRHLVELRAQVLVVAHDLQRRGKLILEVLHYPQVPARIPAHVKRLRDVGFARHEIDHVAVAHFESLQRVLRSGRRRVVALHAAARVGFRDPPNLVAPRRGGDL